jgi:hypothetical protein
VSNVPCSVELAVNVPVVSTGSEDIPAMELAVWESVSTNVSGARSESLSRGAECVPGGDAQKQLSSTATIRRRVIR